MSSRPYALGALELLAAGWNPIPLPPHRKDLPPRGFTGYDAADVTLEQLEEWTATRPRSNVAIRLPANVIGIDVDHYDGKTGADDLDDLETRLGPLPATWSSTARPGTRSGIRFYRIPAGLRTISRLSSSIEIVQAHHRYAVVAPSRHPSAGAYLWHDPTGEPSPRPPAVDELPELPDRWLEAMEDETPRRGRPRSSHATADRLTPPPADVDALVPRLVEQARTFGYLILTAGELETVVRLVAEKPHTALALGPGRIVTLGSLVMHVLPTEPLTTTTERTLP